jgi:hypothetical protein
MIDSIFKQRQEKVTFHLRRRRTISLCATGERFCKKATADPFGIGELSLISAISSNDFSFLGVTSVSFEGVGSTVAARLLPFWDLAKVLANLPSSRRICPFTSAWFCDSAIAEMILSVRFVGLLPRVPPLIGSSNSSADAAPFRGLLRLRNSFASTSS